MTVEELKKIAFDKIDIHWNDFSEGSYKAVNRLRDECFIAGYNEALRWRDPKEELPEGGILVQIKFDCSKYKGHPYSHDVFLSGLNRWNIEHHADIKVTGWRPIK